MHFKTTCSTAGLASLDLNKVSVPVLGASALSLRFGGLWEGRP